MKSSSGVSLVYRLFVSIVIIAAFSGKGMSQDKLRLDSVSSLKEVIVTYQANKTTPVSFQNISKKELDTKSTGQEPSFILSGLPAITVYSDAGSTQGYSYFRLRGIDQTRINISLDAVPLNEPEDQGAYFSNYPDLINSVSSLQIQRGVGTSKNGVASYAGSVQLFSPNLTDSTEAILGADYGSFNSFRIFGSYNSGIKKGKALYVRASQIKSDGYKYNSGNDSRSVFLSSGLFFKKSSLKLNVLAGQQKNELAWLGVSDSLIKVNRRTNVNENERDRFSQLMLQVHHKAQVNRFNSFQSGIYHIYLKGNYDFNLNSFLGLPSTAELYNYAFLSHLYGAFGNWTYSKDQLSFTVGMHGNLYDRRHTGSVNTSGQLYQNTGFKDEISYFTKATYRIGKAELFADLQYRDVKFKYEGSVALPKQDWRFFNPKAGISFLVGKDLVLYYSVGKTGREPTRNDLFGGNDDLLADSTGKALLFVNNPEFVVDHEWGVRLRTQTLHLSVNYYLMNFNNEIVLNGKFGPNGLALTNDVEKSYRTGLEMSVSYALNKYFSLNHHSSFNKSRILEKGIRFSPILTPAVIINQELNYIRKGYTFTLAGRYQSASYIDFANSQQIKGYFLLNARAAYQFKKWELAFFLNNITNTNYFNNGYVDFDGTAKYFVQAPINFSSSIKYHLR